MPVGTPGKRGTSAFVWQGYSAEHRFQLTKKQNDSKFKPKKIEWSNITSKYIERFKMQKAKKWFLRIQLCDTKIERPKKNSWKFDRPKRITQEFATHKNRIWPNFKSKEIGRVSLFKVWCMPKISFPYKFY